MKDYAKESGQLLLNIRKDRYQLQQLLVQKNEALRLQQYQVAIELRSNYNDVDTRLNTCKQELLADYNRMELLPQHLLQLLHINHLLEEFGSADTTLPVKINTLLEYLDASRLQAINHNDKTRATHITAELKLVKEAMKEQEFITRGW